MANNSSKKIFAFVPIKALGTYKEAGFGLAEKLMALLTTNGLSLDSTKELLEEILKLHSPEEKEFFLNKPCSNGETLLTYCAKSGVFDGVVETLVKHGAKLTTPNRYKEIPEAIHGVIVAKSDLNEELRKKIIDDFKKLKPFDIDTIRENEIEEMVEDFKKTAAARLEAEEETEAVRKAAEAEEARKAAEAEEARKADKKKKLADEAESLEKTEAKVVGPVVFSAIEESDVEPAGDNSSVHEIPNFGE